MSDKNTLHGSSFLECCECCQLGKLAANENKTCLHNDLPFNDTCRDIYQRCCNTAHRGMRMAWIFFLFLQSLYWMKHFSFRLAVINECPVLLPSELLLRTHLPTSEGCTAELAVGLWLVVPTTGIRTHASRPRMI